MDEVIYIQLLKGIAFVAGIVGVLIGIDLILGARVTSSLKRIFEKSIDFDSIVKKKLEKTCFDLDKLIASSKVKLFLGIVFLILAVIIMLLIKRV